MKQRGNVLAEPAHLPLKIYTDADRTHLGQDQSGRLDVTDLFVTAQMFGSRGAADKIADHDETRGPQDLFRLAVEMCPNGMIMTNAEGGMIMTNHAVERMFGYESGALLGKPVNILIPEQIDSPDAADSDSPHGPAATVSPNAEQIVLGQRKDSGRFPIGVTTNHLDLGEGLLTLILVADISEKNLAEKPLEPMEARYRGLLEAAPDAMVVVNASGEIVLLNIQAEKRFGYRRDELVGQKVTTIIPEGFAERLIADALRSTEDALAQQIGAGIELSGLRRDGSAFPIEIMLSPLDSVDGLMITVAIRDITTRRNMERLKDEFVATVSHELRTPLTSIAGALGLLAGNAAGKLPDPVARLVAIAFANSQRLVRLINDILDMEKLEFGQVVFRLKRLNVRSFVEQAIEANRGLAEGYGVRIRLTESSGPCMVRVDGDRLLQVFINLLSNAVKFSPVGEEVTVTVHPWHEMIRISVQDRGPGIPSAFRSRVFDKFAQADATDTRQKGGTGLGLSIVKQITTRLGGEVGFEDAPGGGTIFFVDLPSVKLTDDWDNDQDEDSATGLLRGSEVGSTAAAIAPAPRIVQEMSRRPAVLHVDDDADILRLLAANVDSSIDLASVKSLSEARREISARNFDLAVLDLSLGPDSGLDLLPDLYDLNKQAIPVVIFSARGADVMCDGQIVITLDKSHTTVDALLASVLGRLKMSPSRVMEAAT